jgi:hypothetical protein
MRNYIYIFVLTFLLLNSCKDEDGSKGFPGVTTSSILDITEDGVVVFADIQENGVFEILDHGFVYTIEKNAGKEEYYNKISLGSFSGTGSFSAAIERNLQAGNQYVVKAFVKTKDRMVYGNPITFISKGSKSPVLEKFYPETAYIGDTVTISGQYFSDKNSDNAIYFGKTQTYPISSNDKLLKVIVPMLSESATVQLKILVAGKTTIASNKFSLGMPVIYSYTPERVMPLETIEIKGKRLSLVSKITIDGTIHNLTQTTDTTAKFVLSNTIKKGKKILQLTQLDRLTSAEKQLEVIFPEILNVSPLTAWLDTILYIKGTHLDKLTNLSINYEPLTLLSSSDSLLKMKISRVFRSGSIRSKFLNNDILSNQEVKFNPPVITSIAPSTAKYGDVVHVYGERFFSGLSFSGWTCTFLNKNEVTLSVPWKVPPGFFSFKLAKDEEYPIGSVGLTIPPIEITEISPYEVRRGTEITIKVKNLPTSSELIYNVSCLLDNNTSLSIKEVKDGTIKAIIPIYINCSQNPNLTLNVGSQSKSLTNAIHINDKWEKISGGSNLSGFSLFCYSNETSTAYNYDLAGPSLKTFNPQLGLWTNVTKSPYAGFSNPTTSFQLGSDLYFVGTIDGLLVVDKYSTTNQAWSKLSKFPVKVGSDVFAFVINGVAYVGTGSLLYEYDPVNDSWMKKSNTTLSGYHNVPLAFSFNSKGYMLFQYSWMGTIPITEFFEFNPKSNTWLKLGVNNWGVNEGGCATEYNGKLYLCANSQVSYWQDDDNFLEFDPINLQFRKLLPPPEYFYPRTYSFVSGDYFYVVSAGDNYFSWMYRIRLSDLTSL